MIKVLFIHSTLKRCGPIVQIFNLIKNMDPNDFEIFILTLSPEESDSMIDHFKSLGTVKIKFLNLSRIQGLIIGEKKLRNLISTINPDIIHTQGFRADYYSMMLLKNYQIVSSIQNYPFYDYPMKFGIVNGKIMAYRHLAIIKKRKNNIACSESISNLFQKKHNLKINYIQNGVDTDVYLSIADREKLVLKKKLNLPIDKTLIISVGSLIPRKDMTTVIKAFQNCKFRDTLLLIAGDGIEKKQLMHLMGNDKNIIFLGNIPNVKEYLQVSEYFVSASMAEGLPNTVLEAMACGIPVILSNISPHEEIFDNSSYNYFFTIKDKVKLTQLLKEIRLDNYYQLSQKMKNIIHQNFTAELMSQRYQKLYKKIMDDEPVQ